MSSYKTTYLTAPRKIEWTTTERPTPRPGEVLIELHSVGVCGSDVHWYVDGRIGETTLKEPLTLGHEPAGVVLSAGEGVDPALVGRRVAVEPAIHCGQCLFCLEGHYNICPSVRFMGTPPTQGAFRQLLTHPAHLVVPLPDSMSEEIGALLEPLAIGVHAVDLLKVKVGATIVIQGAGPVGLCVLMVARLLAPSRLIVIEPLAERRELALALGADSVYSPEDPGAEQEILRATGGWGAQYVFEAVGEPATFRQMVNLAQPGAKIGVIGINAHDHFEMSNSVARRKGLTLFMVRRSRHTLERAIDLVARGHVNPEPLITHRRGLDELAAAMETLAQYRDGAVKILIDPRT